jgi:hypothetical protein
MMRAGLWRTVGSRRADLDVCIDARGVARGTPDFFIILHLRHLRHLCNAVVSVPPAVVSQPP